jgi:hypothetical protein
MRPIYVIFCTVFLLSSALSQEIVRPASEPPGHSQAGPIYRVTVISRSTKAINYGHITEPTKVGMKGTVLLTDAEGQARVRSNQGSMEIELKASHLEPPTRFGPEYLTYVLWAITPEGRPINLGEVVPDPDNKAKLKVSVDLQAFALIISAEPYFAVLQPSDVVVMENVVTPETVGKVEEVEAKYELLPRKQFTFDATARPAASQQKKVSMDQYEALLALYQAQNAIQIAKAAGADRYAGDTLDKARQLYEEALALQAKKAGSKQIVTNAREAAQTAEDARLITAKRQQVETTSRP